MSEPTTPPEPIQPITSGLSRNVAAGLACIFSILGGVVFFVLEKKDEFIRFWAMQAIFLGVLAFAATIFFTIAHIALGHLPLIGGLMGILVSLLHWAFDLVWLIVYIITIVKAFSNVEWEIPWLGKLARRQLAEMESRQGPSQDSVL